MADNISTTKICEALQYLLESADKVFSTESSLRPELKNAIQIGYHSALEHIAYALDLPVTIHQIIEEDHPVYRRIRARFPIEG